MVMSEKRITKRDNFNEIRAIVEDMGREDLVAFIDNELDLLARRASKKSLTKTQKANLELVEVVFNALASHKDAITVSDLIASDENLATLSTQKVSALLKKLVDAERVVKVTEKGKTLYSIAD